MHRLFCTLIIVMAACLNYACAQTDSISSIVDIINDAEGSVYVVQPQQLDAITAHSRNVHNGDHSAHHNTGYRIQVFSDNNIRTAKASAEARKSAVESEMPELKAYLTFESPYWRVRVGDFRSYSQADAALRELKSAFPNFAGDMRIVREKINVPQ